jgi:hypothetical protein
VVRPCANPQSPSRHLRPLVTPNRTGNLDVEEPPLLILAKSSSYNNHVDTAEKLLLLIERGAKPNVYDSCRNNALHIVMRYMPLLFDKRAIDEMYDILMILVTGRAYVYATNDWGETVSDVALENGYGDTWLRVLEDCGYDIGIVLSYRKGPGIPRPTPRSKLSFMEYCQRRPSLTGSSRVFGASESEPGNTREACAHGPLCNGPLCRLKVSAISGDRWNCAMCRGADFCANCEAFNRLIQFTSPDGKCGNANAKSGEIQDYQLKIRENGHRPCGNENLQNDLLGIGESLNDTNIDIEHDKEDFVPPSSLDLEDLEVDVQDTESEERDFMKLFLINVWD